MALPARLVTFAPLALIKSSEFNSEFNNIVDLLSGASTGFSIRVRNNDNAFAVARFDQLGTNHILELFSNGAETFRFEKDGDFVSPFLSSIGGVYTFTSIPVGPASDPTTDNQFVRRLFVTTRRNRWAASFYIADPAARGVDPDFSEIQAALIPGANFVATHIAAKFTHGSASGTVTIEMRKQPFNSGSETALGSVSFNSGTINVGVETDISDHPFSANDWVYPVLTNATSALQKSVWVSVRGYQTPENP